MHLFPEIVVRLLIVGALLLTGIGALSLLVMIIRDLRNRNIW